MQPLQYPNTDPLSFVVNYLEKSGKDEVAEQVVDVFAKDSTMLEQFNLLAKLYLDLRASDKAEAFALKVLSLSENEEQRYNARANLAKMYNNINRPSDSLKYTELNRAITPNDPDTKLEKVFSLYLLNRKKEAEDILVEMKQSEHTLGERHRDIVNFNMGTYNLEKGNFLEGLGGFLLNVKKLELWFSPRELPFKFWNGGVYPGKTLIMFMEGGGIGDEMITVRFMDDLKKLGFNPVYYTQRPDLYRLFNRCGYKTVMSLDGMTKDSLWTYAMQVPLWIKSTPESIRRENYLFPSEEARNLWKMDDTNKIRIGVRWQGNAKNERDLHRKVPLDDIMTMLHDTFKPEEVEYYSLQIGDGEEEAEKYPELDSSMCKGINSYDDTLALMENLDYVVTSCTSVLHGAAIVGTKTLALIPISAYFTWVSPPTEGRPEDTSIWYGDNLRLFRQTKSMDWSEPLSKMKEFIRSDMNK